MEKILIVHTGGGLGDILLSTPLIEALHDAFPQAEIDFLARTSTAPAVRNHPLLHKVITIDKAKPSWSELPKWIGRLKKEKYTIALSLWSSSQLAFMLYGAGIPRRVGQDSRLMYSWTYTHKVRIRSEHGDTDTHWSDIILDYARALGLDVPKYKPKFVIPDEARKKADELLRELPDLPGPVVGMHPSKGISDPERRWPFGVFADWAKALVNERQARLIITGGPQEAGMVSGLIEMANVPCLNLAGKTDTDVLAAVAEKCSIFVCPDSGPAHLASICGTPVIDIFALKEDFPNRWAPCGPHTRSVVPEKWDCKRLCRKGTCPDFQCFRQIETSRILQTFDDLHREVQGKNETEAD